ncbi:MAG: hypothetical protein HC840_22795 [Leptolyngbyaceae cyanobacterium RM2_2_4]|nr:hypothetical protein [Leptolyngbyaceae cyanobacterium SL_5_14]NJO51775.1 hypothetical protein [Leptolyngbyaceae cyanobacterium RM2_2_4]
MMRDTSAAIAALNTPVSNSIKVSQSSIQNFYSGSHIDQDIWMARLHRATQTSMS